MEKRLEIVMFDLKMENGTLKKEIREIEWRLKNAPTMCTKGTKDLLEEKKNKLVGNNIMLEKLEWIKEGK